MIYLDNASTTRMDTRVFDAMIPYLGDMCGNPNSPHRMGREARDAIARARKQTADLIGAVPEQIVFFHSATDANRFVFEKFDYGRPVVSAVEHSSVLRAARNSMDTDDYELPAVPVMPSGFVSTEILQKYLKDRFPGGNGIDNVASFMLVNNETGMVNDLNRLRDVVSKYRLWLHTDATAAAGAVKIDVNLLLCNFMTFSAHKMHGPKGAAALYLRDPYVAIPHGGTPDVPAIVGFGEACRIQKELIDKNSHGFDADYDDLADLFVTCLSFRLNNIYHVNAKGREHFNRILSLRFPGVDAETLVMLCSERGLMISAGAACESNEKKPSHVLTAMGLSPEEARSSVRVSFSRMTTKEDCIKGAEILAGCVNDLRALNNLEDPEE